MTHILFILDLVTRYVVIQFQIDFKGKRPLDFLFIAQNVPTISCDLDLKRNPRCNPFSLKLLQPRREFSFKTSKILLNKSFSSFFKKAFD